MNLKNLHHTLVAQLAALSIGGSLHTPDHRRRRLFSLHQFQDDILTIQTQHDARVRIPADAFIQTLPHLYTINSSASTPCRAASSNYDPLNSGVCAIRSTHGRTHVINYALPILEELNWVLINSQRWPSTAWLSSAAAHSADRGLHL